MANHHLKANDTINKELDHLVLQELLDHLKARPQVQNIDIMNTAGFCRNCLTKWRHRAARKLQVAGATYEDACEYVYGMPYEQYKKQYQAKATAEQLDLFKRNEAFHAAHDGLDLSPVPANPVAHSSVCCDEFGNEICDESSPSANTQQESISSALQRTMPVNPIRIGILTLSDRAYKGVYKDKSGPAIEQTISSSAPFNFVLGERSLLPDDEKLIENTLKDWAKFHDVILTTGGTGLGKRDVTPQATLKVIDERIPGISEMLRRESAKHEPMAWLSRAEAGSTGSCLIVNLPGNPSGAEDCTRLLLPLLPRVTALLRGDS